MVLDRTIYRISDQNISDIKNQPHHISFTYFKGSGMNKTISRKISIKNKPSNIFIQQIMN